jgi:excisionase family DNA binding protein
MTLPASAAEIGRRLPNATEKAAANHLRKLLAAQAAGDAKLRVLDEKTKKPVDVVLTPGLSGLFMELLRYIGNGDAVTMVPVSKMLTTQQAADILNVSRPFLIALLEKNQIEFTMVGRHRRIKAETLFAYKRTRDLKRSEALSELAAADGEHM